MKKIFSINPCYLILIILFFVVSMIFMGKKKISSSHKMIFTISYCLLGIMTFSYVNGIISSIFQLKYLSVKTYLIVVVIVNAIVLFTLNRKIAFFYSVLNYLLFIITTIILGSTIAVVLGNKYPSLYVMDVGNAVNFIDLSIVIFLLYLILLCLTYIGYFLFSKDKDYVVSESFSSFRDVLKENVLLKKKELGKKEKLFKKRQRKESTFSTSLMTKEELLHFDRNQMLSIHGEDCNIIFSDSNMDHIYQNYLILSRDIHARMVNGYTLEENKMLKSICSKLQVGNLSNIDMSNVSILNKISVEEYQLLRNVFNMN